MKKFLKLHPSSSFEAKFLARFGGFHFYLSVMPFFFGDKRIFGDGVFCTQDSDLFTCLASINLANKDALIVGAVFGLYFIFKILEITFLITLIILINLFISIYTFDQINIINFVHIYFSAAAFMVPLGVNYLKKAE